MEAEIYSSFSFTLLSPSPLSLSFFITFLFLSPFSSSFHPYLRFPPFTSVIHILSIPSNLTFLLFPSFQSPPFSTQFPCPGLLFVLLSRYLPNLPLLPPFPSVAIFSSFLLFPLPYIISVFSCFTPTFTSSSSCNSSPCFIVHSCLPCFSRFFSFSVLPSFPLLHHSCLHFSISSVSPSYPVPISSLSIFNSSFLYILPSSFPPLFASRSTLYSCLNSPPCTHFSSAATCFPFLLFYPLLAFPQ